MFLLSLSLRSCTPISLAPVLYIYSSFLFFLLLLLLLLLASLSSFSFFVMSSSLYTTSSNRHTPTYITENIDRKTHRHEKGKKVNKKKDKRSSTLQEETEQCMCLRVYTWERTRDLLSKYIRTVNVVLL